MRSAALAVMLGAAALVAALGYGFYALATHIDAESKTREEQLVANSFDLHAAEMRRSLEANTIWDEAVRHLDVTFDPAWSRDYIGQYFWRTDGYPLVYVLDADGRPEFAYERGATVSPQSFAPFASAAAPVVAELRARERQRGPAFGDHGPATAAIDASTVAQRAGQTFMLSASLVQTDHSSAVRPSERAPIVVVGEAVDGGFLERLAHSYLLQTPTIISNSAAVPEEAAAAPIRDIQGRTVTTIAWRRASPIAHLLTIAGPPLIAAFATLCAVALALLRHERRRGEALSVATEAAQAASEAKSAFLATMSHEIRTPLNGVLGMAQAMALEPLTPSQQEKLDVVRQSGEALLAILNDVLDLAKIEAGKLELETIEFDLGEVLTSVRSAFTALAADRDLSLRVEMSGAEGVYLGDPTRIRQILFNLLSNAVKFTASGEIRVRAQAGEGKLRLSVADTGEGIAPDKLRGLFEKFTQADTSTTRRYGGTGLGLAICQDLAAMMGGTIEATSELGVGSTFTATLRLVRLSSAPRETRPPVDARPALEPLDGARVLVAEDNPVNQLVIKTLLGQLGVEPRLVDNGAGAVEAWEAGAWDLILMDIHMPVMDGLAATREIRVREQAQGRVRTPIVALTADSMSHQVTQHVAAGMDGHIAKPIEAAALFAAVAEHLGEAESDERPAVLRV